MKKVLALLLALVLLLTMSGCGGLGGRVRIRMAVSQTGYGYLALKEAAKAFNEAQSEYRVELYYGGSYDEIMTVVEASEAGDRPDIFASSGSGAATFIDMEEKLYVPVQDFMAAEGYDDSNIVANLRTNYQRDGQWQCLPLSNNNVGQYYNAQVLSDCGVDYREIDSYADVYDACEALAAAGYRNFYQLRGLEHPDWLHHALTAQGIHYFDNNNGRDGVPTRCLYNDGACRQATLTYFCFLRDLVRQGDWIADPDLSNAKAWEEFAAQEILMMDGYVSSVNSVLEPMEESKEPFDFGYGVGPVIEEGQPSLGQSHGGGALFIAKSGDSQRQQGAWEFMKYLLRDEVVVDYALRNGSPPITTSAYRTAAYQEYVADVFPSVAVVMEAQSTTQDGVGYAPNPVAGETNDIYLEIGEKLLNDPVGYTPEMAVEELAQRVNEALALYHAGGTVD